MPATAALHPCTIATRRLRSVMQLQGQGDHDDDDDDDDDEDSRVVCRRIAIVSVLAITQLLTFGRRGGNAGWLCLLPSFELTASSPALPWPSHWREMAAGRGTTRPSGMRRILSPAHCLAAS